MTKLLAQHGSAKGKKIDTAISNNHLVGTIFSPREESFTSIEKYCQDNLFSPDTTFLDPQLYYSTFDGNILKHLKDDEIYPSEVSRRDWRRKTPKLMNYLDKHAEDTGKISNNLITPGFFIQNLDWRFDYSIDIYEYCRENYDFQKCYLSLLISNNFFHSKSDVDEMLEDIIDSIEYKEGIYLTICYDNTDDKDYEFIDAQNLANILYFIYSLKSAGFEIIMGYTFINSILFAMMGCEYVASGWFNTLRKFNKNRFEEIDTTGRRKKRYTSIPLFTYITLENLGLIAEVIDIKELLSGCNIDADVMYNPESVSFVDLEHQYWQALSQFIDIINNCDSLNTKIDFVLTGIDHAKELYNKILSALSELPYSKESYNRMKATSKHLDSWAMGIETFRNRISLL